MKPTSANAGAQIRTFEDLIEAVKNRKAVIVPAGRAFSGRSHPASFILHQQGATIATLLDLGMYIYQATHKENT